MTNRKNIQEKKGDPKIPLVYAEQLEPILDDIAKLELEIRKKKKEIDDLESQINTKYSDVPQAKELIDSFKDGITVDNGQIANIIETSHAIIELTKKSYNANSAINFKVFMQFCDVLYGKGDGQITYNKKSGEQDIIDVEKTIANYKKQHPQSQLSIYLTTVFNALDKLYTEVTNKVIKRSGSVQIYQKEESVSHINEASFTKLINAFKTFIKRLVNAVNSVYPFKNNVIGTLNTIKDEIIVDNNANETFVSFGNTARGIMREYSGLPEQKIFIPIIFDYYFNTELSSDDIAALNKIGIDFKSNQYIANATYIFEDVDEEFIETELWIDRTYILDMVNNAIQQWFINNKDIIKRYTSEEDNIIEYIRILEDYYDTTKTISPNIPSIVRINVMDSEDAHELYDEWQQGEFDSDSDFDYDSKMNDLDMDDSEMFDNY